MKKIIENLTPRQKLEIKSMAIDLFNQGRYNTTTECWMYAILVFLKNNDLIEVKNG